MRRTLLVLLFCTALVSAQTSDLADAWRGSGQFFSWQASATNGSKTLQIFYACFGDQGKPAILLLHGFPTSSFDYLGLTRELKNDFRVCTFDFPGYGFSDKPTGGYRYTLNDDAELTRYFLKNVAKFNEFVLYSHDRGDSVALNFLQLASPADPFKVTQLFLTDGNMYLPLANLTDFQKRALNPATSAAAVKTMTPQLFAAGMGMTTYTPALKADDPDVKALAAIFGYQDGVEVVPETIKYLNERAQFEVSFLETLAHTSFPVTIIWGVHDMVSPVRVAEFVWSKYVQTRPVSGAFWIAPCGNHYLQHDQPSAVAQIIRAGIGGKRQVAPANLSGDVCSPVLVGTAP